MPEEWFVIRNGNVVSCIVASSRREALFVAQRYGLLTDWVIRKNWLVTL